MSKCEDNVTLFKGWFKDTVPNFLEGIKEEKLSLVHMDADTYTPSKFVLSAICKNLDRGTILIFDEYFAYPGWKQHEFKAWQEFVLSNNLKYRYIGYTNMQVVVEIL